jgi:hypothetical protein
MIYSILKKRYNLTDIGDSLTLSRIARRDFSEYDSIIDRVNSSNNVCVKMNGNDFIDMQNQCINYDYEKVDFSSFDKVIFVTRSNYLDAVLSIAYMNPQDQSSWHRRKGADKIGVPYCVDPAKLFYMYRGYFLFEKIKQHICGIVDAEKIHHYEFETVEQDLMRDFDLTSADIDIDLEPNNLDYSQLATNYDEIADLSPKVYQQMSRLPIDELDNPDSYFWTGRLK